MTDRSAIAEPWVSGLIDGSVVACRDPEGGVSFRITIGGPEYSADECDQLEFVVDADSARVLAEALDNTGPAAEGRAVHCSVGLRRHVLTR